MSLVISSYAITAEWMLGVAVVAAGCTAAVRLAHDDLVEGAVLLGLMTLGAFCLVALDAARRGSGL